MPLTTQESDRLRLLKLKKRKFELEGQAPQAAQVGVEIGAGLEASRQRVQFEEQGFEEDPLAIQSPTLFGLKGAGKALLQTVGNIPESAMRFGENVFQAVSQPIKTTQELGLLGIGLFEKALPDMFMGMPVTKEQVPRADAVIDFFKKRYGGIENLNKTIMEDPVGFGVDVSAILSLGGGVLRATGRAAEISTATKAGQIITEVGRGIEPISAPFRGIRALKGGRPPVNSLVKTALNLPKKTKFERVDELANAFVAKGLNITRKHIDRLKKNQIKVLEKVNKIIDKKTAAGVKLKTTGVVKALDDFMDDAAKQGLELPDLKILEGLRDNFAEQHGAIVTPRQLQNIKMGLNKHFKEGIQARPGLVRQKGRDIMRDAIKSQLEELHPELKALNKDYGVMRDLEVAIKERIQGLEKAPIIPGVGLFTGGVAGGVSGDVAQGVKFGVSTIIVNKIVTSPKIQVRLAKALNFSRLQAARAGKVLPATAIAGRAVEESQPLPLEDIGPL